eukprot:gene27954-8836_t
MPGSWGHIRHENPFQEDGRFYLAAQDHINGRDNPLGETAAQDSSSSQDSSCPVKKVAVQKVAGLGVKRASWKALYCEKTAAEKKRMWILVGCIVTTVVIIVGVVVGVLLGLKPQDQDVQQDEGPWKKGFVRINSAMQFERDCSPLSVVGFNAHDLTEVAMVLPEWFDTEGGLTGQERVWDDLGQASESGMNVLRTWAHTSGEQFPFQVYPGIYNEAALRALDFVLYTAASHGLLVILSLVDNWKYYSGVDQVCLTIAKSGMLCALHCCLPRLFVILSLVDNWK